jgi:hypothetical protein
MSSQVVTVFVPRLVAVPRGADWAASAVAWIASPARGALAIAGLVGTVLAAVGASATRTYRSAERWVCQSAREPQTAQEVLDYAFRIERDMPSLASDLRAAAMRHQENAG